MNKLLIGLTIGSVAVLYTILSSTSPPSIAVITVSPPPVKGKTSKSTPVTALSRSKAAASNPHNYIDESQGAYFYEAAVPEADQKKGIVVGKVSAFRFYGVTPGGEFVLGTLSDKGRLLFKNFCKNPCKTIRSNLDGSRVGFNPSSIIGAAFDDAISGRMRIARGSREPG